ncbi:MAG: hypothetical protein ACYS67_05825 [Planctomycetota bacterium]|jgi:hypothetical protein
MSNKGYAVLLVLAGMICGMVLVSLISSTASAKLPTEERITVEPVTARTTPTRPTVARPSIRVYPVGMGGKDDENAAAYIVKDGKLWFCENTLLREVKFR